MSLWPEPLLNRVLDKRNMISFVTQTIKQTHRWVAIIEWWWLFYSSTPRDTGRATMGCDSWVRPCRCPSVQVSVRASQRLKQINKGDASSCWDDVSTHPLGDQVEMVYERGWQNRIKIKEDWRFWGGKAEWCSIKPGLMTMLTAEYSISGGKCRKIRSC